MKEYDIIIIGGGPAGLTAGLYSKRANLKALLLEKMASGGQLANTDEIENYPGFESISGFELSQKMEAHAKKFGLEIIQEEAVEIKDEGNYKIVKTADSEFKAYAVVLASGGTPRKLNIPGEKEFFGKGVSYCATCDGFFFRNKIITVIGGGDAAVEEALFLTKFGSKVYIVHRRDELRAQKIIRDRAFNNEKIEFIWNSVPLKIDGGETIDSIKLKNVKTGEEWDHETNAVFIFIGFIPNTNLINEGVTKNSEGYIITNQNMETGIPGIFAIGDVRERLTRQVTTSVGDGTTAAVAADKYIETLKDEN